MAEERSQGTGAGRLCGFVTMLDIPWTWRICRPSHFGNMRRVAVAAWTAGSGTISNGNASPFHHPCCGWYHSHIKIAAFPAVWQKRPEYSHLADVSQPGFAQRHYRAFGCVQFEVRKSILSSLWIARITWGCHCGSDAQVETQHAVERVFRHCLVYDTAQIILECLHLCLNGALCGAHGA